MATEVIKKCDFMTDKGVVCGQVIDSDKAEEFAAFGKLYEADLCAEHTEALRAALEPFVQIATRSKANLARAGKSTRTALRGRPGQPFTVKQAREWLQENRKDLRVPDTGRISEEHMQIFKEANSL